MQRYLVFLDTAQLTLRTVPRKERLQALKEDLETKTKELVGRLAAQGCSFTWNEQQAAYIGKDGSTLGFLYSLSALNTRLSNRVLKLVKKDPAVRSMIHDQRKETLTLLRSSG